VGSITVLEHEQQLVLGAIERPHAGIVLGPHDQVLGNQALLAACACQFEQVPPVHEHEQDGAVPRMCLRAAEECRQERGEFGFRHLAKLLTLLGRVAAKADQPGFVRVQRQFELAHY